MSNRRLSDASQAELGISPIIGTSASFTATANSGLITSSNTNYSTARAGSNLALSLSDTARVGYTFDGTTHVLYQTLIEFNVNIPSNAIVASATLRTQYTIPTTTELFTLEASKYNYGIIQSTDFVAGSTLPPDTKFGQTAIPINAGFLGDVTIIKTFDDIDTLRNVIISSGTYQFLIYPTKSKDASGSVFPVSNYTNLSISSCTLTLTYVTAGEVIAALIGAYWGIKLTVQ